MEDEGFEIKENSTIDAFLEMRYQLKVNGVKKFVIRFSSKSRLDLMQDILKRQRDVKRYDIFTTGNVRVYVYY